MSPVNAQPLFGLWPTLSVFFFLLTGTLSAQTLVGGSILSESRSENRSGGRLWLSYQNSFEFKKGMFIDSDFGNIFHLDDRAKRLNVRSVFKYQITDNLKVGAGMGFFWFYDRPDLMQELRFVQEINYAKDFGGSVMFHDFRIEQQIQQSAEDLNGYQTRLRYRFGFHLPTNGPWYLGIYDELFKILENRGSQTFLSGNRAALMVGYKTYQFFNVEAHIIWENESFIASEKSPGNMVFQVMLKQKI